MLRQIDFEHDVQAQSKRKLQRREEEKREREK
jgi:hypothetical protein